MMTKEQQVHWENCILWFVGKSEDLAASGKMEQNRLEKFTKLSEQGRADYEKLLADGFLPSEEEINRVGDALDKMNQDWTRSSN